MHTSLPGALLDPWCSHGMEASCTHYRMDTTQQDPARVNSLQSAHRLADGAVLAFLALIQVVAARAAPAILLATFARLFAEPGPALDAKRLQSQAISCACVGRNNECDVQKGPAQGSNQL